MGSKVKIVTFSSTLMQRAKEVGKAKKSGDPEAIAAAEARLKEYEALVLKSDKMVIDLPRDRETPRTNNWPSF